MTFLNHNTGSRSAKGITAYFQPSFIRNVAQVVMLHQHRLSIIVVTALLHFLLPH